MNKLTEEQKKWIEAAKESLISLKDQQDCVYANLVNDLGFDNDWLFDYIFNCEDNDDYSKFVKLELYGGEE